MSDKADILRKINLADGRVLVLRKPMIEDVEKMMEYLAVIDGESDNLLFGKGEFHATVEQETEYIKKVNSGEGIFSVTAFIGDELVGSAQVACLTRKRNAHNAELGITVRKAYWGMGIGTAMMEELIRYAKADESIKNVHLGVRVGNENAIRLYEKFGFEKVGMHRDYFCVNGAYGDLILMDLKV